MYNFIVLPPHEIYTSQRRNKVLLMVKTIKNTEGGDSIYFRNIPYRIKR
jgi:hypothetical protein